MLYEVITNWYTPWTVYQLQTDGTYLASQGKSQQGDKAILRESFWKYDELMLNAVLHYDRTFGDHTVRGFAGIEQTTSDQRSFFAERKDFPTTQHYELFRITSYNVCYTKLLRGRRPLLGTRERENPSTMP